MDDVTFSHNAANEAEPKTTLCFVKFARWRHGGGEVADYDCRLVLIFLGVCPGPSGGAPAFSDRMFVTATLDTATIEHIPSASRESVPGLTATRTAILMSIGYAPASNHLTHRLLISYSFICTHNMTKLRPWFWRRTCPK